MVIKRLLYNRGEPCVKRQMATKETVGGLPNASPHPEQRSLLSVSSKAQGKNNSEPKLSSVLPSKPNRPILKSNRRQNAADSSS